MPTLEQFLSAFAAEWQHRLDTDPKVRMETHDPGVRAEWNHYLLADGQFLSALLARLGPTEVPLSYRKEHRRFDAAYVRESGNGLEEVVLIENEMGADPEVEMKKLAEASAPLKVLIIYDWSEPSKTTELRRNYLPEKIVTYCKLVLAADKAAPQASSAEHLVLIGAKDRRGEPLKWRWIAVPDEHQRPLLPD